MTGSYAEGMREKVGGKAASLFPHPIKLRYVVIANLRNEGEAIF